MAPYRDEIQALGPGPRVFKVVAKRVPITPAQLTAAESAQMNAAQDPAPQVMVVAGPGTGKSHAILMRLAHVLTTSATPANVYVISFTRATCAELRDRISSYRHQEVLEQPQHK